MIMFKYKCDKLIIILLILIIIFYFLLYLRIKNNSVTKVDKDANVINLDELKTLNDMLSKLQKEYNILKGHKKLNNENVSKSSSNYEQYNNIHTTYNSTQQNKIIDNNQIVTSKPANKKVMIFTMDSIFSYEQNSLNGGASGEITIRRSLEYAFKMFNLQITVIKSDQEFKKCNLNKYDVLILDPWTWATKGWVPKSNLIGQESKIYILDFFGCKRLKGEGLQISPTRILTAFGSPQNTFLGYFINQNINNTYVNKLQQGVIWGKDSKHFQGKVELLKATARDVKLLSTSTNKLFSHQNITWSGHQSTSNWIKILDESKFLLGLGNPILGPSAIDAISRGCMYINPIYRKPVIVNEIPITSQHPFAAEKIGLPYVCNYEDNNIEELKKCVYLALHSSITSKIPKELTLNVYLSRVKNIFSL